MKDLHLTLPDSMAERVDQLARERRETRNGLIRIALEEFFEAEHQRQLGAEMKRYAQEMGEHSREFISETEVLVRKKLKRDTRW